MTPLSCPVHREPRPCCVQSLSVQTHSSAGFLRCPAVRGKQRENRGTSLTEGSPRTSFFPHPLRGRFLCVLPRARQVYGPAGSSRWPSRGTSVQVPYLSRRTHPTGPWPCVASPVCQRSLTDERALYILSDQLFSFSFPPVPRVRRVRVGASLFVTPLSSPSPYVPSSPRAHPGRVPAVRARLGCL